jgi:hypothetical protein
MSVLTDRAEVAYKFAAQETEARWLAWLAEHTEAVDEDGNQVICMFAPDESAEQMMIEVLAYPHPVIIASVVDGDLSAVQLGESEEQASPGKQTVRVERQTVADLIRDFRAAAQRAGGSVQAVQLEYSLAGDRNLVLT